MKGKTRLSYSLKLNVAQMSLPGECEELVGLPWLFTVTKVNKKEIGFLKVNFHNVNSC